MTTRTTTYELTMPVSLKAAVERLSEQLGTSVDQFVVSAVAEKFSAVSTDLFAERKARADMAAFDRLLNREGGQPPSPEDELPPDLAHLGRSENWR